MKTVFVRCLEDGHPGYTKGKIYKVENDVTRDDQGAPRAVYLDAQNWMVRINDEGQTVEPAAPRNDSAVACELLQYNHKRANTAIELLDRYAQSTEVYKAAQECLLAYLRGK